LLRLLAGEIEPVSGTLGRSPNLRLAYFGQTNVERLDNNQTIEEELLAATPTHNRTHARSIAGLMMFEGDAALKRISVLSGGEKSRVLLGKLLLSPANMLLLDEPDNHLDIYSTDALLEALLEFPGAVVIVTHSEMLLEAVATRLIVFDGGRVELFEGGYQDFLARVGWEEEQNEVGAQSPPKKLSSPRELRRRRAEVIQRRSRALGPLQTEASQIEREIAELEKASSEQLANLIDATQDGYSDNCAKLSRILHQTKRTTEERYSRLVELHDAIERLSAEFARELSEIE